MIYIYDKKLFEDDKCIKFDKFNFLCFILYYIKIIFLIITICRFSCSNWFESKPLDNLYILMHIFIITKIHCSSESGKQFYLVYILFYFFT